MDINELSLKERLILCWRVEQACSRSFRELADRMQDAAPELSQRIKELSEEEEAHARAVDRYDDRIPWPLVWRLDEAEISRTIRHYFPILTLGVTLETLDRVDALNFIRAVEEESSHFYQFLADQAPDNPSRHFFEKAAELEHSHLKAFAEV